MFGTSPYICFTLWKRIAVPEGSSPKHLLWALMLLKTYAVQELLASLCGVDEKTFRKWSWVFVNAISVLEVVRFWFHYWDRLVVVCGVLLTLFRCFFWLFFLRFVGAIALSTPLSTPLCLCRSMEPTTRLANRVLSTRDGTRTSLKGPA